MLCLVCQHVAKANVLPDAATPLTARTVRETVNYLLPWHRHIWFALNEVTTRLTVNYIGQLADSLNGLVWRMPIPLWRTVNLLALKHIPVRVYVIVVCRLPVWSLDTDNKHPVVHGAICVQFGFPRSVCENLDDDREQHGSVVVKLVECVVSV